MSESPSCDAVVVARPASSSFPAVFVPAAPEKESGDAADNDADDEVAGVNFIGDDDLEGAVTPPAEEEAETPVSPTTPIGGVVEAVRSADDDPDANNDHNDDDGVEIIGTAPPASRPSPVAADV